MNKKYNIIYLPLFYKDMSQIKNHIIKKFNNKISAINFINDVRQRIETRSFNPESFEKYSSNKRKTVYYRIYIKNYILFHTVHNNTIEIHRILHNKRNFDNLV